MPKFRKLFRPFNVNVKYALVFALFDSNIEIEKGIFKYFKIVIIIYNLLTSYIKHCVLIWLKTFHSLISLLDVHHRG
jgi:hypothetical protein